MKLLVMFGFTLSSQLICFSVSVPVIHQDVKQAETRGNSAVSQGALITTSITPPQLKMEYKATTINKDVSDLTSSAGDLSPRSVAEFLMASNNWKLVEDALAELIQASLMTEEEAQKYYTDVSLEYDALFLHALITDGKMAKLDEMASSGGGVDEASNKDSTLTELAEMEDDLRKLYDVSVGNEITLDDLKSKAGNNTITSLESQLEQLTKQKPHAKNNQWHIESK